MNMRMLGRIFLPAVLCAEFALVPVPAAGQGGAGVDTPQQAARHLAEKLVYEMLHKDIQKQPVALLPPDPDAARAADSVRSSDAHDAPVEREQRHSRAVHDCIRQLARNHLRVDRAPDAQRAALRDQAQVAHILDVAGRVALMLNALPPASNPEAGRPRIVF